MAHRGDLTARMVELQLLLTERAYSQRELIAYFKVDRKTIKRDIDILSAYYPILEEQDGREIRYRFSEEYKFASPPFTPSELATLLLAQESIAATGLTALGTPFAAHARRLLTKVRASLPERLRGLLSALAVVYGSAHTPAKDFAPYAEIIEQLTDAALNGQRVLLRYQSLTDNVIKERMVEPYCVYFDPDGATLKLIGYDSLRHDVIPFSVDHIRSLKVTDGKFARPPDFDLSSYLTEHCFNGIHGSPVTVRLRSYGTTARIFAERQFHPSQRLIETTPRNKMEEETTTIEMRVAGGRGLARFILSWTPEVEVLSPATLREEVAAAHRRALARLTEKEK
ncbi:MAG: WYL domain-containing protein [Pyrinomonadaceae bacterium]